MTLGCGDGRILITAVNMFRADRAVGYEIREDLCGAALREIERQRVRHRVKLVKGDLFDADLYEATVIALYLDEPTNQQLKLKLEREARDGTRIVSHAYEIKGWRAAREKTVQGNTVYLYRVPESFAATERGDRGGKEEA